MKVWFKKCWHRIVSLFCAAVIAFTTIAYSYPVLAVAGSVAAGAGSILAVLGVIGSIKEFCENCQWVWEIVEPIINKIKSSNASAIAEQQEYYRCYWKEIVSKGQLTESKFREYWTFVVTNGDDTSMEAQYPGFTDTYSMLIETVASGLSLDSLCESIFSNSSDYSVDEKNNPVVSGSAYKRDVVDYWSEYYKPHENASQYIWSYQSTNSKSAYPYTLDSDAPLYMSTNGNWGRKDWDSGVYLMVFYCDDNNTHGYYYSSRYCHVYSKKDAGATTANVVFDFYDVASGQLVDSAKSGWMAANFPFLGLNFDVSCSTSTEFLRLFKYSTYANYMSKSSSEWGLFPTKLGNFIASDYSDSNAFLTSLCRSVSFTPSSNTNDDYGLIMSSEPFELPAVKPKSTITKYPITTP